ncbi:hypothetical protein QBC38DRAFT_453999 [Podospora fimiseda]|uniref:Extracellular membrane protein CFEM domain-containing protein n=1 Tax=Podospora fimiseda TaxID=252190 RepID=A0AAN7BSF6_9PEZI|nr:hypothetical protein QBC38DRAFT_453999 [Podospora fimiseda]
MHPSSHTLCLLFLYFAPIWAQLTNVNALGCETARAIVSACVGLTPALASATAFYQGAPCYCYVRTAWAPSIFDNAHTRCYSWISSVSPQAIASETARIGGPIPSSPCKQAGNLLGAPSTATETELIISQTTDPNYQACQTAQMALERCASLTPGFTTITDIKSQASCLCYSGLVWNPSRYDSVVVNCLKYLSTGSPSQYSALVNRPGGFTTTPCAMAGDVRAGVTPGPGGTTPFPTPTQTTTTTFSSTTSSFLPVSNIGGDGKNLSDGSKSMLFVCAMLGVYMAGLV